MIGSDTLSWPRNPFSQAWPAGTPTMPIFRLSCAAGAIAALGFTFPAVAADDPAALVEALRGGGHVVFIRHAATKADYPDQTSAVVGACATQRMLSEDGRR